MKIHVYSQYTNLVDNMNVTVAIPMSVTQDVLLRHFIYVVLNTVWHRSSYLDHDAAQHNYVRNSLVYTFKFRTIQAQPAYYFDITLHLLQLPPYYQKSACLSYAGMRCFQKHSPAPSAYVIASTTQACLSHRYLIRLQ
jgi:hypothetical protein